MPSSPGTMVFQSPTTSDWAERLVEKQKLNRINKDSKYFIGSDFRRNEFIRLKIGNIQRRNILAGTEYFQPEWRHCQLPV